MTGGVGIFMSAISQIRLPNRVFADANKLELRMLLSRVQLKQRLSGTK
jgi:hypothetical protein